MSKLLNRGPKVRLKPEGHKQSEGNINASINATCSGDSKTQTIHVILPDGFKPLPSSLVFDYTGLVPPENPVTEVKDEILKLKDDLASTIVGIRLGPQAPLCPVTKMHRLNCSSTLTDNSNGVIIECVSTGT